MRDLCLVLSTLCLGSALAVTCDDVKHAYKDTCCGNANHSAEVPALSSVPTGYGSDVNCVSTFSRELYSEILESDSRFKAMLLAYRTLLKRDPTRDEVHRAFTVHGDTVEAKKTFNQIESDIVASHEFDAPSKIQPDRSLADDVYVVVGGSGGLGFSVAVSMAAYTDIGKVVVIGGRSAKYFEAQKKVALTNGDCQRNSVPYTEYVDGEPWPSHVQDVHHPNVQALLRRSYKNTTVQLRKQTCDPTYFGPVGVDPKAFAKIEFFETDIRDYAAVERAVAHLTKAPIGIFFGQCGLNTIVETASTTERRAFFEEYTRFLDILPSADTIPTFEEFEQVASSLPEILSKTSDRQTSSVLHHNLYESMPMLGYKRGSPNVFDALVAKFGLDTIKETTVFTDASSSTAFGPNLAKSVPSSVMLEYLAWKRTELIRSQIMAYNGYKTSTTFADGIRTQATFVFFENPTLLNAIVRPTLRDPEMPFMYPRQILVDEEDYGVYASWTNEDLDAVYGRLSQPPLYVADSTVFMTPHAHAIAFLHSWKRALTVDTVSYADANVSLAYTFTPTEMRGSLGPLRWTVPVKSRTDRSVVIDSVAAVTNTLKVHYGRGAFEGDRFYWVTPVMIELASGEKILDEIAMDANLRRQSYQTSPKLIRHTQNMAETLDDTARKFLDPSVHDLASDPSYYDCTPHRVLVGETTILQDSLMDIMQVWDWD